MSTYTVSGTYGGYNTPCEVHCFSTWGGTWYAVDGPLNVNLCADVMLNDGVDIEALEDFDTCTANEPITDCCELEALIEGAE